MPNPTQDARPFEIGDRVQVSIPGFTAPGRIVGRFDYEGCTPLLRVRMAYPVVERHYAALVDHHKFGINDEGEIDVEFSADELVAT